MDPVGSTRDHHVPQMYLKRFACPTPSGYQLAVSTRDLRHKFKASVADVAVESGFYWGTDADGVPHHHLEGFLTAIEGAATTGFRSILDRGKQPDDDALPRWPPRPDVRTALSWWIAAQVLRTVRQRTRLTMDAGRSDIRLPDRLAVANHHLRYIADMLEPLAATVFSRPWGVGFSDYCLLTGDVPVLILNGQDHRDQQAAVDYWDLYLPLDPHRCLYLPGLASERNDRRLRRDHRLKLHAGHAVGLNSAILDACVRHVFFHPDHDPTRHSEPALDLESNIPQFLIDYDVMGPGVGVQRRWLDVHPSPDEGVSREDSSFLGNGALVQLSKMMTELNRREEQFQRFADDGPSNDFGLSDPNPG